MTAIDAAAWHDVECASYAADMGLWRDLAADRGGPVLDLGCGTGRVALGLASAGHEVLGVDADPVLVSAFNARAGAAGLSARAVEGDVRSLDVDRRFALVLAPMQVAQLLGGPQGRAAMLARAVAHLAPGGLLAVALADPFDAVPAGEARPPLPDVLEIGGWVLSSAPIAVRDGPEAAEIDRLRQAVSPTGDLVEERTTTVLDYCAPATLEDEARGAGLRPAGRRAVAATGDYVGSVVVLAEAPV